ncbi:MAG: hypothetical protein WC915_04635 [archaeon]|jgi:hypothetical protein
MPRPKNYRARAIGMIGASILAATALTKIIPHSIRSFKGVEQSHVQFEQKQKQKEIEFQNKRKQIEENLKRETLAWQEKSKKENDLLNTKPVLNISSVLWNKIPLQNRISHNTFVSELVRFNSPLANQAVSKRLFEYCVKKNLDPAYFLAKSRLESHHGTDSKNRLNKNVGNLKARKNQKSDGKGFATFSSFEEGARAMIDRLVSDVYIGSGRTTVKTIEHKYAPPIENATNTNISVIQEIRNNLYKKEAEQKQKIIPKQKPIIRSPGSMLAKN